MRLVRNSYCYDKSSGEFIGRLVAVTMLSNGPAIVARSGKIGASDSVIVRRLVVACYVVAPIGKHARR
jgi:hypothetical protein